MRKKLLILIAATFVLALIAVMGVARTEASAEDIRFTLETRYGNPSAAEGLAIHGFRAWLSNSALGKDSSAVWDYDLKIENGTPVLKSLRYDRNIVVTGTEGWRENDLEDEISRRRDVSASDPDGIFTYRCVREGENHKVMITGSSGELLHSVILPDDKVDKASYPVIYPGRGSAVIIFVRDRVQYHPARGINYEEVFCVTSDGNVYSISNTTYDGYYLWNAHADLQAASNGDRATLISRNWSVKNYDETGSILSSDYLLNSPCVWIFGPDGLIYFGIIRCSLDEVYNGLPEPRTYSYYGYRNYVVLDSNMSVEW